LTTSHEELTTSIKSLLVETLMLRRTPESITDDTSFYGPEGLGLDSIDTITLLAELERRFGLSIQDPERARVVLKNVATLVDAIATLPPPAKA